MRRDPIYALGLAVAFVQFLVLFAGFGGCTNNESSRRVLEQSGYTDVELTGYELFACGEGDVSHVGFRATNPSGQRVSGVVCCGLLKSCTVRF